MDRLKRGLSGLVSPGHTGTSAAGTGVSNINYMSHGADVDSDDDEQQIVNDEAKLEDEDSLGSGWAAFFARGREFESRSVNHRYTKKEQVRLSLLLLKHL